MALKTAMIDVGGGFRAIFGCGVMEGGRHQYA